MEDLYNDIDIEKERKEWIEKIQKLREKYLRLAKLYDNLQKQLMTYTEDLNNLRQEYILLEKKLQSLKKVEEDLQEAEEYYRNLSQEILSLENLKKISNNLETSSMTIDTLQRDYLILKESLRKYQLNLERLNNFLGILMILLIVLIITEILNLIK